MSTIEHVVTINIGRGVLTASTEVQLTADIPTPAIAEALEQLTLAISGVASDAVKLFHVPPEADTGDVADDPETLNWLRTFVADEVAKLVTQKARRVAKHVAILGPQIEKPFGPGDLKHLVSDLIIYGVTGQVLGESENQAIAKFFGWWCWADRICGGSSVDKTVRFVADVIDAMRRDAQLRTHTPDAGERREPPGTRLKGCGPGDDVRASSVKWGRT